MLDSVGIPQQSAASFSQPKNYNALFCDGPVSAINPAILFSQSNSASLWNYDHQPHPELWIPYSV
jgi:hypothetical protein